MTVEQIAKKHDVSVESIEHELSLGVEIEKEHGGSYRERREYALDHLEEIPDYYTRLTQMEKEAKKDDRKEMEGLTDEQAGKAFDKWKDLGETGGPEAVSPKETYYPSISLKVGKDAGAFKVGEEMEIEFKACVESVEKTKDGVRIRLELKEAKFD